MASSLYLARIGDKSEKREQEERKSQRSSKCIVVCIVQEGRRGKRLKHRNAWAFPACAATKGIEGIEKGERRAGCTFEVHNAKSRAWA